MAQEVATTVAKDCSDYTCSFCISFATCKKDTAEALAEAQKAHTESKTPEDLKSLERAKKSLLTDANAGNIVCGDFKPCGKIPKEVDAAFAILAQMPSGTANLFQWKMDKLSAKRALEEELGIHIGDDYFGLNGKKVGVVVDIERGRIKVRKDDGKNILIKTFIEEVEDDQE